jgi:hypothetical protein
MIEGGFFGQNHLQYTISIAEMGWTVRRKDKEFNFVRDTLVKMYPHIIVPVLVLSK